MKIYKHKTESGIFKKYMYTGRSRYVMYENIFTGETIGNPPYPYKCTYRLTQKGKWKESDFYIVSER